MEPKIVNRNVILRKKRIRFKSFCRKIQNKNSKLIKSEMVKIKTEDEAEKFMEKYEISGTAEELRSDVSECVMESGELSDDELGNVAGGELNFASMGGATLVN